MATLFGQWRPAGLLLFSYFLAALLAPPAAMAQVRQDVLLTTGWRFTRGDVPGAEQPAFADGQWQRVQVPHDWAIGGPFDAGNDQQTVRIAQNNEQQATIKTGRTGGLPYVGVGWYRRALPAVPAGRRATLLFDGAMSDARVFVNGREVGRWPYGYNSFFFDITAYLQPAGPNVLAVRLENRPESSRWYPGAGLYRHVHLLLTAPTHVPVWGTTVTTPGVSASAATVVVRTPVHRTDARPLRLVTTLLDPAGKPVADATTSLSGPDSVFAQTLTVAQPRRWSPEDPALYVAASRLYAADELVDEVRTPVGLRTVELDRVRGLVLNGQPRQLRGVCNHHDLGPLGAAVSEAGLRRQLLILQDLGADALRTTHNMPAPELVRLADELGFLLIVEAFDEWKTPKIANGYNRLFDDWAERDLQNMVRRDRNHPSVIMWSIGNEVPDQWAPGGVQRAQWLKGIMQREDPTRPVTAGMDQFDAALQTGFAAVLDVPGFNYKPHRYPEAHAKLPQGLLLGSETASTVSSRGVYHFPPELAKDRRYPDNQSSSYDLEACNWSQTPDEEFVQQDDLPYVIGEFVWTGFDYLGEPTPYDERWPSHSSYFGICDLAGLPKDRYYLYRARWNRRQPTLHLLPHWTWPGREGQPTPVFCYTNYPTAELFVNGQSQGRRTKTRTGSPQERYRLMWNEVKYAPGTLRVVAYDSAGRPADTAEVRTAGAPHHVRLVADRPTLAPDGQDLLYVTARVEDAAGTLCPDATAALTCRVRGAATFRAQANGDPTCLTPFPAPTMAAFHGQLVAVVQAGTKAGPATITVSAPGLKSGKLKVAVR